MVENRLFDVLVNQNEITWKDIIFDIIKQEGMDPWNVNIRILTGQYISYLNNLKKMDFKIGGKVVLAAALLLKIKSKRLVGDDLDEFDRLIAQAQVNEDEFYDDVEAEYRDSKYIPDDQKMTLIPKTPQPRKRQVSIYDLVGALEKALEVKKRRIMKSMPDHRVIMPKRKKDISLMIKHVYNRILDIVLMRKSGSIKFSHLLDKGDRDDKIWKFIPLLYLYNSRKIDLEQKENFGEIDITVLKKYEK